MSINNFVHNFVRSENEIYSYSKKERRSFRNRLESSLIVFINTREKNLHNQIHYLKRKNYKLEREYDLLSNIAVTSFNKTIENDLMKEDEDEEVEEEVEEEADDNIAEEYYQGYYQGYKKVAFSFVRMVFVIYLAFLFVYVYDYMTKKTETKNLLEWK
jgi:hypothetical protein